MLTTTHSKQKAYCLAICSHPFTSPLLFSPSLPFTSSLSFSSPILSSSCFTPLFPALALRFLPSSHLPLLCLAPLRLALFLLPLRQLTVLLVRPSLLLPPSHPPLPSFILGSPTVVMRCFIICISQLLIEREFRLSPGSSVRELPWETLQA